MQLGMIGLGRMGGNMTRRLLAAGHECVVFSKDPAEAEPFRAAGAAAADGGDPVTVDRILAPLTNPGKILGSGVNYASHGDEEPGYVFPDEVVWDFIKLASAIVGPGDDIVLPPADDVIVRRADSAAQFAEYGFAVDYEVEFGVVVTDPEREASMRLASAALCGSADGGTWRGSGDSTFARYVVDGEIEIVPGDRCPRCWGGWGFPLDHPECPSCGVKLGEGVKLLLDSDVCPHCEKGRITRHQPRCTRCGFEVNPEFVVWG